MVPPAKLSQIERAESALRQLGFAELQFGITTTSHGLSCLRQICSGPSAIRFARRCWTRCAAPASDLPRWMLRHQSGAFTLPLVILIMSESGTTEPSSRLRRS